MTEPLLALQDLAIAYDGRRGETRVVRGVSLALHAGEALGLVGESGCGKSTVALSIVRYLGRGGRIAGGRILFRAVTSPRSMPRRCATCAGGASRWSTRIRWRASTR